MLIAAASRASVNPLLIILQRVMPNITQPPSARLDQFGAEGCRSIHTPIVRGNWNSKHLMTCLICDDDRPA
jgi:hypothetical protein